MKAAIFKGVKQMACEEHAEPTIIDGGRPIIRVVRACVCGSDHVVLPRRQQGAQHPGRP